MRLKKIAEKYGWLRHYVKEDDLILINDKEVEAVYIATPTYLHHPQTLKAARAGKHILCEKPMAINLKQVEEMIRVCQENKVKLTLNYYDALPLSSPQNKRVYRRGSFGNFSYGKGTAYLLVSTYERSLAPKTRTWRRGITCRYGEPKGEKGSG